LYLQRCALLARVTKLLKLIIQRLPPGADASIADELQDRFPR
jgi:hypothetical protein